MADNKFDYKKGLEEVKSDRNKLASSCGALAVILGLFLPWYSISIFGSSVSASPGLGNGTGILLLLLSVATVGAMLNVLKQDKKNMVIVSIVTSVLAALIMLNNWPDSVIRDAGAVGIGYWLGLAGSFAMVAGAVLNKVKPVTTK